MKKFILAAMMVLAMALMMVPTVSAQSELCFDLSADDCAIVQGAYETTNSLSSFQQDFSIDFSTTGLGEIAAMLGAPIGDLTFNVSGSGPFALTGDNTNPVVMSMDMMVSASGLMPLDGVEVPFAITDGFMYLPGEGEIIGIPLDPEAAEGLAGMAGGLGLPVDPGTALEGAEALPAPATFGDIFGDMGDTSGAAALAPYVSYVRLPDSDMMGQTVYPFEFTLDLAALLNSPEIQEALGAAGEMAGDDPTVGLILGLLPAVLADANADIIVTQYVGADDNFIHGLDFGLDLSLDLGPLLSTGEEMQEMPLDVNMMFQVDISEINSEVSVAAPEGARQLTPDEVNELFAPTGPGMDGG